MFDNVLHQSATGLLCDDIANGSLPGSILFAGPAASAKLTCALELARVLSCQGAECGSWACNCASCVRHRALVSPAVLLAGPGTRTLEIRAARDALVSQYANSGRHLEATRILYVRAVRKLTARFNPVLWQDDDKLPKCSPLLQSIDEALAVLEARTLPAEDELTKLLDSVQKDSEKLEGTYLYDSLPVSHIRAFSSWARLSSASGKKVIILENADRMADSARNALLKILEEPPQDCQFILTTCSRSSLLPTILSRVRTYHFFERPAQNQQEVISRVFHYRPFAGQDMPQTIDLFLKSYLPVSPATVSSQAAAFFASVAGGHMPDVAQVVGACCGFEPRVLLRIFLGGILDAQRSLCGSAPGCEASARVLVALRKAESSVFTYNQNPVPALEELSRNLMQINHAMGGIFATALRPAV